MNPDAFDLLAPEMPRGITVLDASAGTGKTFTLAAIYVRLVVEHGLMPGQILVTTYTVAATAELRDRIRKRLAQAADALRGAPDADAFLQTLCSRVPDRAAATRHATLALQLFDEAWITTIHGFCSRVLGEEALTAGTGFDARLAADQSALLGEVTLDFWRRHFLLAPAPIALALKVGNLNAESLHSLLNDTSRHPDLVVLPGAVQTLESASQSLASAWQAMRGAWLAEREKLAADFTKSAAWFDGRKIKPPSYAKAHAALASILDPDDFLSADSRPRLEKLHEHFERYTLEKVRLGAKAGAAPPARAFFAAVSAWLDALTKFSIAVRRGFLDWAGPELLTRRAARGEMSFDDLLIRLRDALRGENGARLANDIGQRLQAALVDEFQDTDPAQAEIFLRIFGVDRWLYLIGDPKQAIYGFRGADVFAYLAARSRADRIFTLGVNYRSTRSMVGAVNELFAAAERPFVLDGIEFHPATAAGETDREPLIFPDGEKPALQCWHIPAPEKPLAKTNVEPQLVEAAAELCVRLLSSDATMGETRLQPGDIALLVRSNDQARAVHAALGRAGLPAVLMAQGNVLESDEAAALEILLAAIAEPARERLVRAALALPWMGFDAPGLLALEGDEAAWEKQADDFHRWHELWQQRGFAAMIRRLIAERRVRSRLLAGVGGERSLTNLLHLAELLQQAEREHGLAPAALKRWLSRERRAATLDAEKIELRLESDDGAVKVLTVHKSKGLQFNVVVLPFACAGSTPRDEGEQVFFHHDGKRTLHLSASAEAASQAERESLAEEARLLYVALTRARYQTHLFLGRINGWEHGALHWLLFGALSPENDIALTHRMKQHGETGVIGCEPLPEVAGLRWVAPLVAAEQTEARRFSGQIVHDWRVGSFTGLLRHDESEGHDYDAASSGGVAVELEGIHAFPRGMEAGTALHGIFEDLDFTNPAQIESRVKSRLARHGLESKHEAAVSDCVRRVLNSPMPGGWTLGEIGARAKSVEVEFYLPIRRLEPGPLSAALAAAEGLEFAPQRGFLKGFVDLLVERDGFWIVDWKSNWLGPDGSHYTADAVNAEMRAHRYELQAAIYAVALCRWLRGRVKDFDVERDFRGALYLFVRGMDAVHPLRGVWHGQFSAARLAEIEQGLTGEHR